MSNFVNNKSATAKKKKRKKKEDTIKLFKHFEHLTGKYRLYFVNNRMIVRKIVINFFRKIQLFEDFTVTSLPRIRLSIQ